MGIHTKQMGGHLVTCVICGKVLTCYVNETNDHKCAEHTKDNLDITVADYGTYTPPWLRNNKSKGGNL